MPITDYIARWRFDETSGTAAADDTGTYNATFNTAPTWAAGQIGNCAQLNAAKHATFTMNLSASSFSISAWINSIAGSEIIHFSLGSSSAGNKALHCRLQTDGNLVLGFFSDDLITTGGVITAGVWTHVVYTYNSVSKLQEIWVNAISKASRTAGADFTGDTSGWLAGWVAGSNEEWNGSIDETRVYDRVLSSTEITDVFNFTGTSQLMGAMVM